MPLKKIIFYILLTLNLNTYAIHFSMDNNRLVGDINNDGIINILDIVQLVNIILD